MDVDATFKTIQNLYKTLSGKSDAEVTLTYKGTSYGVTKPWHARIDSREATHVEYNGALLALFEMLKKELSDKIKSTESEASRLRQVYKQLEN